MKEGGEGSPLPEQASSPLPVPNSVASDRNEAQQRGRGRIWSALGFIGSLFFRANKHDFEKRLQHLTQEEVTVHRRLKKRTQNWRKVARALIIYSVVGEVGWLLAAEIFCKSLTSLCMCSVQRWCKNDMCLFVKHVLQSSYSNSELNFLQNAAGIFLQNFHMTICVVLRWCKKCI